MSAKLMLFCDTAKKSTTKNWLSSRQPISKTNYLKTNLLKQIKKIPFLSAKLRRFEKTAKYQITKKGVELT